MRNFGKLLRNGRGAAAAEMALVAPMLLILMLGSFEVGNYFRSEHILAKSVRDGARYAARQPFTTFAGCSATLADVPGSLRDSTMLIVRNGTLSSSSPDLLPDWGGVTNSCSGNPAGGCFEVKMSCSSTAGGTTLAGIYRPSGTGVAGVAPRVVVTAKLPYHPVIGALGFRGTGYPIQAESQAAVTGI